MRLAQPVPFDAPDGGPVSLVFVLLVPEKATEKHLQILSELAQMFSDKALREAMSRAPDAAALYELIAAGSRMLQVNVARLHEDNREALGLAWVAGREGGTACAGGGASGLADRPPQPHPSQQHPGHRRARSRARRAPHRRQAHRVRRAPDRRRPGGGRVRRRRHAVPELVEAAREKPHRDLRHAGQARRG